MELIKKRNGRPPIKESVKERVIELYNSDELTCPEIAKVCNISKSSVFRIVSERRAMLYNGKEKEVN